MIVPVRCAASICLVILLAVPPCTSFANPSVDTMPSTTRFFIAGPQAALEVAVRANDVGAIARALAGGADVNARGKLNVTPLMVAVDVQGFDAVNALLKAGAVPNALADDRNGPVSLAVQSYRAAPHGRDILAAIFKAGGDPNARRPDGDPVIFRFIEDHDADSIRWMKTLGADLDIRDRGNDPLITSVAMAQDWDMVWSLITQGAKYDYERGASRQPLSMSLSLAYPARDSPLYAYKLKVWQLLKDQGLPVKPMNP